MDFNSNDNEQTVLIPQDAYGQVPPQQMMNNTFGQQPQQQMPNNAGFPQAQQTQQPQQQMPNNAGFPQAQQPQQQMPNNAGFPQAQQPQQQVPNNAGFPQAQQPQQPQQQMPNNAGFPQAQQPQQQMPNNAGFPQAQQPQQQMPNNAGFPQAQQPQQQMPNNAGFPQAQQPQQPQYNAYNRAPQPSNPNTPPKKKKTGLIIGIIVGLVLIIAGVCAAIFIPKLAAKKERKAAEEPVEKFFEGYTDEDLEEASEAFHPEIRDVYLSNVYTASWVSDNDEYWDKQRDTFGGSLDISYKITKTEKVKNIDELKSTIRKTFYTDFDIKKAYSFTVEETYKGANGTLVLEETIITAKLDGEWYIVYAVTEGVLSDTVDRPPTGEPTEEPTTEAPTTEAPTTEAPTEDPFNVPIDSEPWDWDTMPFYINGGYYELAYMTYEDILDMGYTMDDEFLDQELEDDQFTFSERAEASDGSYIYVRFKNFLGVGTRKVRDCEILGITFDYSYNDCNAQLVNGITEGMSMYDCESIMGEGEEYISEDGFYSSLDYEENDNAFSDSLSISFTEGALTSIDIECYD